MDFAFNLIWILDKLNDILQPQREYPFFSMIVCAYYNPWIISEAQMLAEFSITPIDKEGKSLSEYIAKTISIVKESGLQYELHAMGTIIEGDADEIFELIKKCHINMTNFSERVSTSIKIDDRKGTRGRLKGKVLSVEKKLKQNHNLS